MLGCLAALSAVAGCLSHWLLGSSSEFYNVIIRDFTSSKCGALWGVSSQLLASHFTALFEFALGVKPYYLNELYWIGGICHTKKQFISLAGKKKCKKSLVGVFTRLPVNLAGLIFKGPKFKACDDECYDEVVCPSCGHTACNNMCFTRAAALVTKINKACNLEHGLNFTRWIGRKERLPIQHPI